MYASYPPVPVGRACLVERPYMPSAAELLASIRHQAAPPPVEEDVERVVFRRFQGACLDFTTALDAMRSMLPADSRIARSMAGMSARLTTLATISLEAA